MGVRVPRKYAPRTLTRKDRSRQIRAIRRSRAAYKRGKFIGRPHLRSAKTRRSKHTRRLIRLYDIPPGGITLKHLSRKSGCSMRGLRKILSKGRGAFYSSGSRPNQSAESWAIARLHSALTGGPAAVSDMHILKRECRPGGKARRLSRRALRKKHRWH